MATLSWVPRITQSLVVTVSPTITAAAYVTGNRLGSVMTIPNVVRVDNSLGFGTVMLESINIQDKAAQSPVIDIWFFNSLPTIASADRAAFDLTDANMALQIGSVNVGTSWSNSTSNGVNLGDGTLNKIMQCTSSTIYAQAVIRSSATFTSTTDLKFEFGFLID